MLLTKKRIAPIFNNSNCICENYLEERYIKKSDFAKEMDDLKRFPRERV